MNLNQIAGLIMIGIGIALAVYMVLRKEK